MDGDFTMNPAAESIVNKNGEEISVTFTARDKLDHTTTAIGKFKLVLKTCFVAGTKISTENGLKNIEDIKVGEYVYTLNEKTKKVELKQVLATHQNINNKFATIKTERGTSFKCTSGREIYVEKKGWTKAKELKVGDKVLLQNGNTEKVTSVEIEEGKEEKVYNLTVEDNHNYFVSPDKILVHNIVTC